MADKSTEGQAAAASDPPERPERPQTWWEAAGGGLLAVLVVAMLMGVFPLIGYVLSLDARAKALESSGLAVARFGPGGVVRVDVVEGHGRPTVLVETARGERLGLVAVMPEGIAYPLPGEFWAVEPTDQPAPGRVPVRFVQRRPGFGQ